MYDEYVENPGFGIFNPIVRPCFKKFVRPLRKADYIGAQGPDYFVTISDYAAKMIKKYYDREATVIAPPVEIKKFKTVKNKAKREGFINYSRQVSWKRQDLAIRACIAAGKKLTIIGSGPEHNNLVKAANNSKLITFLPAMSTEGLREELIKSEGFIFPSIEPFGIAPVEALAAGCPVIALNEGGARDYVKPGKNGELFKEQSVDSLTKVLKKFDYTKYKREEIIKSAEFFDVANFKKRLKEFIDEKMA
jgi:glycosyltransferase involved in cell wall biosynthesis